VNPLLAQNPQIQEFQKALQRQFETSWSVHAGLIVAAFFTVVVLLVWYLSRRESRVAETTQHGDPQKLFRALLQRLPLATSQRQWLSAIARDLKLAHPTMMLLSPALFQQTFEQWQAQRASAAGRAGPHDSHIYAQVQAALFPSRPFQRLSCI
jgi:hypothetical protein